MDCAASSRIFGGEYQNPGGVDITPSAGHATLFYRFFLDGREDQEPKSTLPVEPLTAEKLGSPPEDRVRVTWMGHSTLMIDIAGIRLLTDPNLSRRASPVSWAGPRRFLPLPMEAENFPKLDAVLISHNHYDHLDQATIRKLMDKTGRFLVPKGVGALLREWGAPEEKVVEMDWWQEYRLDGKLTLAYTPAQHFSARGLSDRNKALWGSWAVVGPGARVYFSGDTGMFDCFKTIGEKYGPFDFTLMHIGAYADVWPKAHMTPEDAVAAHMALRGGIFLPIHWGAFRMAFHPWKEPAERFYAEAQKSGIKFTLPKAGQMVDNVSPAPAEPWWRSFE